MERLAKPSRPFMHDNDHRGFFNVQRRLLESHTLIRGGDTSTKATPFLLRSYVITLDLKPRVGSESLGANCVLSHPLLRVLSTFNAINIITNGVIITTITSPSLSTSPLSSSSSSPLTNCVLSNPPAQNAQYTQHQKGRRAVQPTQPTNKSARKD